MSLGHIFAPVRTLCHGTQVIANSDQFLMDPTTQNILRECADRLTQTADLIARSSPAASTTTASTAAPFLDSFLGQCLSNVFIYNSEKGETFFQQNEMPGEHFILGIMTECCRYFYGAMMPECNFYSQFIFTLENNVSLQN